VPNSYWQLYERNGTEDAKVRGHGKPVDDFDAIRRMSFLLYLIHWRRNSCVSFYKSMEYKLSLSVKYLFTFAGFRLIT
jgi:hypothetical protein